VAQVMLRAPLSEMCGGRSHTIGGATVVEVLASLEATYPAIAGWILDERKRVREHVNIFVNGDHAHEETTISDGDRVHVLPAITGG
jgi:sulfur-carrier protein